MLLLNDRISDSNVREADTQNLSRFPPPREDKQSNTEKDTDKFIGKRIAKYFDNTLFFGTVVERMREALLADQPTDSRKVLHSFGRSCMTTRIRNKRVGKR